MSRIFLSYASPDKARVRQIADSLQRVGHVPWFDEDELVVGEPIAEAMTRALRTTDFIVVCLSGATWRNGWMAHEFDHFIRPEIARRPGRILPVRLEDVELPPSLTEFVFVDLFPDDTAYERGIARLLRALEKLAVPPNNLPPRRLLVGREVDLAAIDRAFLVSRKLTITSVKTSQTHGIGKTALALEWAHRAASRGHYKGGIFWVSASGPMQDIWMRIHQALRDTASSEMAIRLAEVSVDGTAKAVARATRKILEESRDPWLLILDGIADIDLRSQSLIGQGHLLFTADSVRASDTDVYVLERLLPYDSIALARTIAGEPRTKDEAQQLERIVTDAGASPLFIELAAPVVAGPGGSWQGYRNRLRARNVRSDEHGEALGDDNRLLYPAMEIALEGLTTSLAWILTRRDLMIAIVAFAAEPIPIEWLERVRDTSTSDPTLPILMEIEAKGLIRVYPTKAIVSIHSAIHARVRTWLMSEDGSCLEIRRRAATLVADIVDEAHASGQTWRIGVYRRHVEQVMAGIAPTQIVWFRLALPLVEYFEAQNAYSQARELLALAVNHAEKLDPHRPDIMYRIWRSSGEVDEQLGDVSGSRLAYGRALQEVETKFPAGDPLLREALNNLGESLLQESPDPEKAIPLLTRALELFPDDTDPEIVPVLSNLGAGFCYQDNPAEALTHLSRALPIAENAFGPDHSRVAEVLHNLANCLVDLHRSAEAKPLLERALNIHDRVFGGTDPRIAAHLYALASVMQDLQQWEDARPVLERAVIIDESLHGREFHPDTERDLLALAEVLDALSLSAEARNVRRKALFLPVEAIEIQAFRGISQVTLEGFERVNLLVGDNNAGKTSHLEAIAIYAEPTRASCWTRVATWRGMSQRAGAAEWLFPHGRSATEMVEEPAVRGILISGMGSEGPKAVLASLGPNEITSEKNESTTWISFHVTTGSGVKEGRVPVLGAGRSSRVALISPFDHSIERRFAEGYRRVVDDELKTSVVALMAQMDPLIQDIEFLPTPRGRIGGIFILHKKSGRTPLGAFGDGVRRVLLFALTIPLVEGGILLVDEIDTSIHISVLGNVFQWLVEACRRYRVQLFATTHSIEAIDAMLAASKDKLEEIAGYRFPPPEKDGQPRRFAGDQLFRLRERGLDVRGGST